MTHPNRRKSSRAAVDFFVEERRGERSWLHPAIDLSVDGLYVLVSDDRRALDPTAELELEFTLPTGSAISARARIAYIDDRHGQRGLGLEFVTLGDGQRDAIERFVEVALNAQHRVDA